MKYKLNIKNKKIYNIVMVLIFSILFFTMICVLYTVRYQVIDDVMMMKIISGTYTGKPSIHGIFMIFPFTLILKILYLMCNKLDWYAISLILCEFVFYIIIMYKIIKRINNWKAKIITLLISSALITFFFPTFLSRITFTEVSIFIMICVNILFFLYEGKKSEKLIIIFGTLTAFTIRTSGCLMLLPMLFPIGLYKSYKDKQKFRQYFVIALEITLGIVIIIGSNKIIDSLSGWKEYNKYNAIRSKYYDYYTDGIDNLSKEDRDELLKKSGITGIDYNWIKLYYIGIDENLALKLENLVKIYENDYYKINFNTIFNTAKKMIFEYKKYLYFILLLLGLNIITVVIKKDVKKSMLLAELTLFLIIILAYLIFKGRITERVMQPLFFFNITMLFIILISNKEVQYNYEEVCNNKIIFIISMLVLICAIIIYNKYNGETDFFEFREINNDKYYKQNKSNFYVYDVHSFGAGEQPIHLIRDNTEDNSMSIGDWIAYSPVYYEKLEKMHVKNMKELLLKNNVYLDVYYKRKVQLLTYVDENLKFEKIDELGQGYLKSYIYKVLNDDTNQ